MTLRRKWEEKFFHVVSGVVTLIIIFVLLHLIWSIVDKGASYLSWDIISKPPKGTFYFGGEGGGFLNAIAGSFSLAVGSTVLAFVVSLPVPLFLNVYLIKSSRLL